MLYGVASVFSILFLIILISELLKRWFKDSEESSLQDQLLVKDNQLTDKEVSAVSIAVASYLTEFSQQKDESSSKLVQNRIGVWGLAGKIEATSKDTRR